jgi:hypothetical protein
MKLEKYSVWVTRTRQYEGIATPVPVAPTGPGFRRAELTDGWRTGMADPQPERAMVKSLQAWIEKVVMPFRAHLSTPAQIMLDKELLRVMHMGKGKSYNDLAAAADAMCDRVMNDALLSGSIMKPSQLKSRFPELFPGGSGLEISRDLPANGGFVAASRPTDAIHHFGRCAGKETGPIAPRREIRVHDASKRLFQRGADGSAWSGICQMGARCNRGYDLVYLVPNEAVGSHLGFIHNHETRQTIPPGEHGHKGETSHHYACYQIEHTWGFDISDGEWNGYAMDDWFDPQSSGIFWGFSMLKAFNCLGHLYAWTSVSTNRFGSSIFYRDLNETDPTLSRNQFDALSPMEKMRAQKEGRFGKGVELGMKVYGGETDVAKDWAYHIWKATKDLT